MTEDKLPCLDGSASSDPTYLANGHNLTNRFAIICIWVIGCGNSVKIEYDVALNVGGSNVARKKD